MNPRSSFLAAAFGAAAVASAQAADMSTPFTKAPPLYVPPAINWNGFYVGGHLGGAWSEAHWTDPITALKNTPTAAGVMGGGQAGFNYQTGPLVFGIEGDFSGTGLKDSSTTGGATRTTTTDWTSTLTGRLGYAFDHLLLYGKGGAAFADERYRFMAPNGAATAGNATRTGWTAGAGVEYAIDRHWSVRAEYDYLGLGSQTVASPIAGRPAGSVKTDIQRGLVGIDYRF